jgi:hypothetical protein
MAESDIFKMTQNGSRTFPRNQPCFASLLPVFYRKEQTLPSEFRLFHDLSAA